MAFERFTNTARSFKPRVTVRQSGTIGLNAGAVNRFGLRKFNFAVLFYDKGEKRIGIKPAEQEEQGAHKLNLGKSGGAWIGARRFLEFYDIQKATPIKSDAEWDDREKMIVVEL